MNRRLCLLLVITLGLALVARAQQDDSEDAIAALQQTLSRSSVRDKAVKVIVTLSQDTNAVFRANAIEAMHPMPDRALPLAQRGLADPSPIVQYTAVVTAGMYKFESLKPAIRPLLKSENPSVRAASIFALHHLGDKVNLTPLAGLLEHRDPSVRANVAMLLGLMGEKSAIPMLKQAADAPLPRAGGAQTAVVRCQFAEAIVRLGDDSELDTLRASAYNTVGEVRVLAINAMGAVGDRRMIPALQQFLREPQPAGREDHGVKAVTAEPVEVRLAAASSLARMGNPIGLSTALKLCEDPNPVVRSQAVWALGWFQDSASQEKLAQMVDDPMPMIRIAAAASVVRRSAPR